MYIVEWNDHEGNQRKKGFDRAEDAQTDAIYLKTRFDYVKIKEEPKKELLFGDILTVPELAELAKICTKTAYEWTNIPGFPVVKIGNVKRVPRGLFMDWFNAHAQKEDLSCKTRT